MVGCHGVEAVNPMEPLATFLAAMMITINSVIAIVYFFDWVWQDATCLTPCCLDADFEMLRTAISTRAMCFGSLSPSVKSSSEIQILKHWHE